MQTSWNAYPSDLAQFRACDKTEDELELIARFSFQAVVWFWEVKHVETWGVKYVCIPSCELETKTGALGNTPRPSETTKVFSFLAVRTPFMLYIPNAPSFHPHGCRLLSHLPPPPPCIDSCEKSSCSFPLPLVFFCLTSSLMYTDLTSHRLLA